jgi:hypothetical protein
MSTQRTGSSAGTTRTCPHCRATILDSASVCPACRHHLRFEPGAAKRAPNTFTALQVDGTLQPPVSGEAWEYTVVIAVRNARGEEVNRQVVGVGALQPAELRTFTVSVEVMTPRDAAAPVGTVSELRATPG